jgi:MFS family permease
MLLIAGAIADIVGARIVELVGTFLLGILAFGCGLAQTGVQLVVFRAIQGVATAMHLPASVALVAAAVPPGRARNIGFGCLGLSQPLGFSVGLVVCGIMIEKVGWRSVFYLSGGATLTAAVVAIWALPKVKSEGQRLGGIQLLSKMWNEIDWVGGVIASAGLAILAYVLALVSADLSSIRSPTSATLLPLSIILLVSFPIWMHFRERSGRPALVPNALWKNLPFASTCIMVALSNGAMNSIELFSSLLYVLSHIFPGYFTDHFIASRRYKTNLY